MCLEFVDVNVRKHLMTRREYPGNVNFLVYSPMNPDILFEILFFTFEIFMANFSPD